MKKVSDKQEAIEKKLRKAKQAFVDSKEPFCEGCGRSDRRLSVSHTISVKRCKEIGKPELIYDPKNFSLDCCCDSSHCHNKYESAPMEEKIKLSNFTKRFLYILEHDIEKARSIMLACRDSKPELIEDYWK